MFALGVMTGSFFWALLATLGVSEALIAWSHFIMAIKVFGGVYLLWLAFKSGRSALTMTRSAAHQAERSQPLANLYGRGALLHLTNPKAILVWISIAALASSTGTGKVHAIAVIPGCVVIGMLVFGGYAVVFSTATARRLYTRTRRALEGCLAIVFGVAGTKLLTSRV
jgi:threonine/homoserine/homoserine lactone efflux protein